MEFLGRFNERNIFYISIPNKLSWHERLPDGNWIAFTIANESDRELLVAAIPKCLDRLVSYICCSGQLGKLSEEIFDEEIVVKALGKEIRTSYPFGYNYSPVTTAHNNIQEGLQFAIYGANDEHFAIDKIVCLDFTTENMKERLMKLLVDISIE
ncbi:MAG: hypothetical protein JST90_16255 [Bacteroidetes bacterium]|nr:hypothetical protein [Bacteroidota bacterium]